MDISLSFLTGKRVQVNCTEESTVDCILDDVSRTVSVDKVCMAVFANGKPLQPESLLMESGVKAGDVLQIVLRLLGGKGGFGSNLRQAGKKDKGKVILNFDACRDLAGRRIRHVNQEKMLAEWKPGRLGNLREQAHELSKKEMSALDRKERFLAKQAELKKAEPTAKELKQRALEESIEKIHNSNKQAMQDTQEALLTALKRPRDESDKADNSSDESSGDDADAPVSAVPNPAKKPKLATGFDAGLDLSSDDDDDDE